MSALTVMAMDVRHVLYGPSLRSRIIQRLQKSKTALWAFGLTDRLLPPRPQNWYAIIAAGARRMIGIAFSSWSSWVFGTVIGAFPAAACCKVIPPLKLH
ncbi:AzlC family ABC transporter permease [Shigella flexneri]